MLMLGREIALRRAFIYGSKGEDKKGVDHRKLVVYRVTDKGVWLGTGDMYIKAFGIRVSRAPSDVHLIWWSGRCKEGSCLCSTELSMVIECLLRVGCTRIMTYVHGNPFR